jgi:hypothetical protein
MPSAIHGKIVKTFREVNQMPNLSIRKDPLSMPVSKLQRGPLLEALLAAQDASEAAVSYPAIVGWADALIALATELGDPLLLPVSGQAERLVGAATLAARGGGLRVRSPSGSLNGERVLLVDLAVVTPLQLLQAARNARLLGAADVAGCAISINSRNGIEGLDSYADLFESSSVRVPTAA